MMKETEDIVNMSLDFLPLKTYPNIVEANALRLDWEDVVPKNELDYIMGNPPFSGFTYMTDEQKKDMSILFPGVKNLDYVSCWFKKAESYIKNTPIKCCFVATSSIAEGETVARLWERLSVNIIYAYQSFKWESEASQKASVYCVIIGFSFVETKEKWLFKDEIAQKVENINPYLVDGPNVLVKSRNMPICNVPQMVYGNKPADGGHLIIENDEIDEFLAKEPQAQKFVKPLLGAREFINNQKRYCLWLVDAKPEELRGCPLTLARIRKCKESRESSKAAGIRKFAATPTLFAQITQPKDSDYILIPRVSSERRKYIPMGFLTKDTIVTDAVQIVPDANLYDFGVLTSNVHMAWMRAVAGRLELRYRYSKDVVYNNFPWPNAGEIARIEGTAKSILVSTEQLDSLYFTSNIA